MLQFAKGVPLGEKGLDWLKIHLVTLHGAKKKSSLQERLDYANEIMDDIVDSAENPLMVNTPRAEKNSDWLSSVKVNLSAVVDVDQEAVVSKFNELLGSDSKFSTTLSDVYFDNDNESEFQ